MGGKNKQAQRTKNNVRPSSSSRSAEMLGPLVPAFVGFAAGKDGGLVPVLPGLSIKEEFDPNIDTAFQLIFKKMAKKDTTTKLKALQEFTALVSSSEETMVCSILSVWPRYYSQLSLDVEHRIRESTQIANRAVVGKCGRSIAPFLKQLIPIWMTSQYDTYVPAALQAQAALQSVFPISKLPEVMMFCKAEILAFITDNLIFHTPNTLSNPKMFTTEECESKYERVIIGSLQGYALFINHLPEAQLEWLCTEHVKILENNKFWALGASQSPQIRTGCHAVIGSLCQRLGSWFGEKYGRKATQLLLKKLNEKDSLAASSLWENSILLMASIPEWWTFVDVEKEVLEGACECLSGGGWGSAGRIAPLMLPLLAQFSSRVSTQFYDAFFDSILKGLEQRSVVSSKSECTAWLSGLAECVRYVSMNALQSEGAVPSLSRAVRLWLETVSRPHISINPYTPLKLSTPHLSALLLFWTKRSLSSGDPTFSQLIRIFWQNVSFLITSQVEKMPPNEMEIKEIADAHRELLFGLKNMTQARAKKVSRVKFDSDPNESQTLDTSTAGLKKLHIETSENDAEVKDNYNHRLRAVAYDACAAYLIYAKTANLSAPVLTPLYSLMHEFDTPDLYIVMLKKIIGGQSSDHRMVNLYTNLLFEWLKGDSMRSVAVVDLIFAMFKYLSENDQKDVLKSFDQLPLSVIKWCISRCLSYPHSTCPAVRDWLHSNTVNQSLLTMSHLVVKEGDRHHATLLKMCFAQDNNEEIPISQKTCSEIISILGESLSLVDSVHLDMCASFASQLAASMAADDKCTGYNQLLLSLFTLNCNVQGGTEILSQDTWWEVNTSWQDALPNLSWENLLWFAESSTDVVYKKLVELNSDSLDVELVDILVGLTTHLISSCVNVESEVVAKWSKLCKIIRIVLKLETEHIKTWLSNAYLISLNADVLNEKFDCFANGKSSAMNSIIENSSSKSYTDLVEDDLKKMLRWTLYCTKILDKIIFHPEKPEVTDAECEYEPEEDVTSWLKDIMSCDEMKNILSIQLYNICVVRTLSIEYQAWSWYTTLSEYYKLIENTMTHAVTSLPAQHYGALFNYIKSKADNEGMYWSVCLYVLDDGLRSAAKENTYTLKRVADDFSAKLQATENLKELLTDDNFNNIQVLLNECKSAKEDPYYLKVTAMIALRSIYLTCNEKKTAINITKESIIECMDTPLKGLAAIVDMYYQCKELMLYDIDFSSSDWNVVQCNTCIVHFLVASIELVGWELESLHWDFITISLSSLMQSMEKSKHSWSTTKVSLLGCAVFRLFTIVDKFVLNIPATSMVIEPTPAIASLPQEWNDIFAPDINLRMLETFMAVFRDCLSSTKLFSRDVFYLGALCDAINAFSWKYIASNKDSTKYPMDTLVEICLALLSTSTHHIFKFIAHKLLKKITPMLKMADEAIFSSTFQEDSAVPLSLSLHKMVPTLSLLEASVQDCLNPYKVGEDHPVLLPHTESYNIVLGYIFLWETLLDITQESAAWLHHQYTELFRESQYVDHLVQVLFRLLPSELLSQSTTSGPSNYFKTQPELHAKAPVNSELMGSLACHCLMECLRGGSTAILMRGWWGCQASRLSHYIEQIVSNHISPLLITQLLLDITTRSVEWPSAQIVVHWSVNELVCTYTVEEKDMTLTVGLCSNYPLGVPRVASSGTLTNPVPWITMLLSYQNSSLFQALSLWMNSLRRKIESAPECYVCYAKLHYKTGELPKSLCRVCRNKFHKSCLLKWFNKSTKATCPLCRSNFQNMNDSRYFEGQ